MRYLSPVAAVALLLISACGYVLSRFVYGISCDENCDGHSWQASGQLICASLGLLAAAAGVVFSSTSLRRDERFAASSLADLVLGRRVDAGPLGERLT
jgi:hypothetical protein